MQPDETFDLLAEVIRAECEAVHLLAAAIMNGDRAAVGRLALAVQRLGRIEGIAAQIRPSMRRAPLRPVIVGPWAGTDTVQ